MRQKVIIKLFIDRNNRKSRTKAIKIAVSQSGVESATIKEGENFDLEVVGEHIDAVVLTNCLRKKLGHAHLMSVAPVVVAATDRNNDVNDGSTDSDANPQPHGYPYFASFQILHNIYI
ncbi:uncharacterized protein LOC129893033 [Solanum dulcamara]|uniref:uncharacterized protein LOC129893033 n=1 Tax=Solanum dulcamara TaxID=45834 RepID=UPI002485C2E0|nr:uncharacterized protein LOC129893033 [Solanum dulcamara]